MARQHRCEKSERRAKLVFLGGKIVPDALCDHVCVHPLMVAVIDTRPEAEHESIVRFAHVFARNDSSACRFRARLSNLGLRFCALLLGHGRRRDSGLAVLCAFGMSARLSKKKLLLQYVFFFLL
eukprot:COSAG02_NODE_5742_length_4075_cov_7.196454_4_plen_124_part_00